MVQGAGAQSDCSWHPLALESISGKTSVVLFLGKLGTNKCLI